MVPVTGPVTGVVARRALALPQLRLWFPAGVAMLTLDETSKAHILPASDSARYNHWRSSVWTRPESA